MTRRPGRSASALAADTVPDATAGTTVDVPPAFDAFYRREQRPLVALVLVLSGNRATAEDIAQDAMVAAYRDWDRISRVDDPAAWVRRIAANQATSALRRRGAELRALTRLGGRRQQPALLDPPDERFWAAVRTLPRRQAQAVALTYVHDLSTAEVAAVLGCTAGTVKQHLHRARAALEPRLRDSEGADR
jgi:RNA polymerase sigma-70 factor (ECF subfamily)